MIPGRARRDRIEELLAEGYRQEGYKVEIVDGVPCALIPRLLTEGLREHTIIDLAKMAEYIDARLP